MIFSLKSFLSMLMVVINFFTLLFSGDFAGKFEPADPKACNLNFAAISDIHMTDSIFRAFMLELGLYEMEHADTRLDALVVTGDITDHGEYGDWENLKKTFAKYDPADNIIFGLGNHDTWTDEGYEKSREYFIKYNKEITGHDFDKPYYSYQVNDYTFIVLASEGDRVSAYFSPEQIAWLDAEMAKAAQEDKPIFVVSHWPINQSHGLPETWGDEEPQLDDGGMGDQSAEVEAILKKHKNVFLLSGHIHNGVVNDRQEDVYHYRSVESDGSFHSINLPTYMYATIRGRVSNGTGMQFEVYDDSVLIRTRSYSAGVWYTDYVYEIELV